MWSSGIDNKWSSDQMKLILIANDLMKFVLIANDLVISWSWYW